MTPRQPLRAVVATAVLAVVLAAAYSWTELQHGELAVHVPQWMLTRSGLEQRCLRVDEDTERSDLQYDVDACGRACRRGVPGPGGCLMIGRLAARSCVHGEMSACEEAAPALTTACAGGFAEACMDGAIVAEHLRFCRKGAAERLNVPSTAHLYERACALGNPDGCKRAHEPAPAPSARLLSCVPYGLE